MLDPMILMGIVMAYLPQLINLKNIITFIPWWGYLIVLAIIVISKYKVEHYSDTIDKVLLKNELTYIQANSFYYLFSTIVKNKQIPLYWVFGKWFIGYVKIDIHSIPYSSPDTIYSIHIIHFRRKNVIDKVVSKKVDTRVAGEETKVDLELDQEEYRITIYRKMGVNKACPYEEVEGGILCQVGTPEQMDISRDIIQLAKYSHTNGYGFNCVVAISGDIGCGKSYIGRLVCRLLMVDERKRPKLCDNFRPTELGHYFESMCHDLQATFDQPSIIIIDEFDKIIQLIHTERTPDARIGSHYLKQPVMDKASYTTLLDKMGECQNVIVICTLNTSFETLDELDRAYLRDGRIHKRYIMTTPIAHQMQQKRFIHHTD